MPNKCLLSIIFLLLAHNSFAAYIEISQQAWLSKLKDAVPSLICKSFFNNNELHAQLEKITVTYEKCVSLIPASFINCQKKYQSQLPAVLNEDSSAKWGQMIGECIGDDFAKKYLTDLPAASKPLAVEASVHQPIPKAQWLEKVKMSVPDLICKGFFQDESLKSQLQQVKINYDQCIKLIPNSVNTCTNQYYDDIPLNITDNVALEWGHKMGECIGRNFAVNYLFSSNTHTPK